MWSCYAFLKLQLAQKKDQNVVLRFESWCKTSMASSVCLASKFESCKQRENKQKRNFDGKQKRYKFSKGPEDAGLSPATLCNKKGHYI